MSELNLEKFQEDVVSAVETKLEGKANSVKEAVMVELEAKLNAHKQEMIELTKSAQPVVQEMTDLEKRELERLNACVKAGEEKISLEQYKEYKVNLQSQMQSAMRGEEIKLDATIAGIAGFDDARGGALIIPEVDKNIRQDFAEYDEGLFNAINFIPATSRTLKAVIDTVEPEENVQAVKETLKEIGYTLDDGGFVSAMVNLKDYDSPARITYDQIEDTAFRIENYINGKLPQGTRRKAAKDLWIGNSAEKIKGIINYPRGNKYGQVGEVHVAATGVVTMDDIMNLCRQNRNKGVLFIDRATWGQVISEKDDNGRYVFELGAVAKGMGAQPFHVDAVVPLLNVPVIFDDAFTLPEAVAANIKAAILPPSAVIGYRRPTGRFMIENKMKFREMLLTERYDAVLAQFKYVKVLNGVQAS